MEVANGEAYSRQAFENYFFAADVVIGVLAGERSGGDLPTADHEEWVEIVTGTDDPFGPSGSSHDGQLWADIIAGFYYVRHLFNHPLGRRN